MVVVILVSPHMTLYVLHIPKPVGNDSTYVPVRLRTMGALGGTDNETIGECGSSSSERECGETYRHCQSV
jgi:hypothetical protein